MTFGEIASIAADLVEVVALILLILQLIHLKKQLRLSSFLKVNTGNRELIFQGLEDLHLLEVIESGKPIKEAKAKRYSQSWINQIYLIFYGYRMDLYDQDTWDSYRADIADFMANHRIQEQWKRSRSLYPKPFQKFMESVCPAD